MSRITIRRKNAGGSGCARKTARSTKCPAITSWKNYLDAYIKAAGIEDDRKGPLFRSAIRKTKKLTASARCRARMSGTWCAAVLPMRELKPR